MSENLVGFLIGVLFGGALFRAGLADPDKIIGTLRLKDFHAMRVIVVFVLVGMGGTWVLSLMGLANFSVKPAYMVTAAAGGALLGIGFGLSGFCPGTGLACAAAGRVDALVSVVGMVLGALVYILIFPSVAAPLEKMVDLGKITLPEYTKTDPAYWVVPIFVVGVLILLLTRPRRSGAEGAAPSE